MKEKCQVFTPLKNVKELLDAAEYTNDLYGKKVIENACGDGNILKEIVRRYIEDSLRSNRSIDEIKRGLERDVYGAEIDKVHYIKCIRNLNEITSAFGINEVKWNILNIDFLKHNLNTEFDYVIGNPPYITYRELDSETRDYLKENFTSCESGKFDYCYAFIEASLKCLSPIGKFAYLIPNSIFKNVFAQRLRDLILPNTLKIIDYTTQKLFKQATSSAILVCDKSEIFETIEYYDVVNSTSFVISKNNLIDKWIFTDYNQKVKHKRRFGDYFSASISIATLLNNVYILKKFNDDAKDVITVGSFQIERDVIREAVSPRSLKYKRSELIIFPYSYNENQLVRYNKDEFERNYPGATKYLKSYAKELSERNSDKSVEWFEYGRSQALAHLNQPKLLLSTVITKEVKVYELTKECIPYSGIYIVPKKDLTLANALEILKSEHFYKYVQGIGINASGSSLRITAVDINNYEF